MTDVGIRALKQNASAVVAEAAAGTIVTITDRGRPVAQLVPMPADRLSMLIAGGHARPARRSLADVAPPVDGPSLSVELSAMRDEERG